MPPKSYLTKKNYEHKTKPNGTPNPKYVDLLEVDKPIAGQAFGCFSFISPEKIIKERNEFYFEEFLKSWEMNKSMEKFHQFLNFVSYKYKLNFQEVIKDFESFIDYILFILSVFNFSNSSTTFLFSSTSFSIRAISSFNC